MTPAGFPPGRALTAWHRRFPDRLHLWVGSVRLWRADLPVRQNRSSKLSEWIAKAAALGLTTHADQARRLGLAEPVIGNVSRPARRAFVFLDLPGGPLAVPVPPEAPKGSPEVITADDVPPAVLRPPGVEVVPLSDDWRTVPVVRAERLNAVAVRQAQGIEIYAAGRDWEIGESPAWTLPADALPVATADAWSAAWREWCRANRVHAAPEVTVEKSVVRLRDTDGVPVDAWILAGDGPLREAAVVVPG